MTQISLPYGDGFQTLEIPEPNNVKVISMPKPKIDTDEAAMLNKALDAPINSSLLEKMVTPLDRIVIIVNDHTRPGPTRIMVEAILKRLASAGVQEGQITFVVATGSHRVSTEAEIQEIIGPEVAQRYRTECHNCLDDNSLAYCGTTSSGLPLYINKTVVEATFRITTGLIAPHHSAGFSGGRKSIVPGVAGLKTLHIHHSLPIRPFEPVMGMIQGNSFHDTALEGAQKIGVNFIVNAVQDANKQNIAFVAGELVSAHEAGVKLSRDACEVKVGQLADIVITSPGGHPRDINLWQSQKALSTAEVLVKPGGTIILVAECRNGFGEGVFRDWLVEAKTPEEVIERFRLEGFNVGSNKAFMVARALTKARIIIVSHYLSSEELRSMHLEGAQNLEEAFALALPGGVQRSIMVLPRAVTMIPVLND